MIATPVGAILAVVCGVLFLALASGETRECGAEPAGAVTGVPAILATINYNETGFGANLGPSSAKAREWDAVHAGDLGRLRGGGNGDGHKDTADPWGRHTCGAQIPARVGSAARLAGSDFRLAYEPEAHVILHLEPSVTLPEKRY